MISSKFNLTNFLSDLTKIKVLIIYTLNFYIIWCALEYLLTERTQSVRMKLAYGGNPGHSVLKPWQRTQDMPLWKSQQEDAIDRRNPVPLGKVSQYQGTLIRLVRSGRTLFYPLHLRIWLPDLFDPVGIYRIPEYPMQWFHHRQWLS